MHQRSCKMDKQKHINEIADIIFEALNNKGRIANGEGVDIISAAIYNAGYRKIPENSVVLTREYIKKYVKDCIAGQETGLDIINALISRAERYKEKAKKIRKETAEKFAERLKYEVLNFCGTEEENGYFERGKIGFCEEIDEICKEFTESKV